MVTKLISDDFLLKYTFVHCFELLSELVARSCELDTEIVPKLISDDILIKYTFVHQSIDLRALFSTQIT